MADTHNGVFAVDVSDPCAPTFARYFTIPSPAVPTLCAQRVFSCRGQVHSLTEQDGYLLLSCGDEGLYALDGDLRPAFHWKTGGAAHYLTGMNGLLFVAEGDRGVGCYRFTSQAGFAPVVEWQPREEGCPLEEGVAVDGERIFMIRARQYAAFRSPSETIEACHALRRVPGAQLRGIPFLLGDALTLLNRVTGVVEQLDVRDAQHPSGRLSLHALAAAETKRLRPP